MKSGLIQQQPGLIQAERQHASSWSHQGRFILQNWKCIFRTEPGKCRFRRRSSIPWQDHYGICRAPSNTGVSWGDFMLNLPEDQAHSCRCNKPSTAGMGRPHPQLLRATPGTRGAAPIQWPSQQRNQSILFSPGKPQQHPCLCFCSPASTLYCPTSALGIKQKDKRALLASCCLPAVLNPCDFLQLKGKLVH